MLAKEYSTYNTGHISWALLLYIFIFLQKSVSESISPRERYLNVYLVNSDTNSIDCKFKIIIHVLSTGSESPLIQDIQSLRAISLQMKTVKGRVKLTQLTCLMPNLYRIQF